MHDMACEPSSAQCAEIGGDAPIHGHVAAESLAELLPAVSSKAPGNAPYAVVPGAFFSWVRSRYFEPVALLALFVAAFLVYVWGISGLHYWDELVYLQNADALGFGKTNYSELDSRPPLLSLLFAGVFCFWHSIYAACLLTAMLNALGPVLLYRAGKLIASRSAAATAALLMAFAPFLAGVFPVGFVSDATGNSLLSDLPSLTLTVLGFWLLLRALRRPRLMAFALAGFGLALAVLTRFAALGSVSLLFVLPLLDRRSLRSLLATVAGFAVGVVPYLCWSRLHYGGFLATLQSGWNNFEGPVEPFTYFLPMAPILFTWAALGGVALCALCQLWKLFRPSKAPQWLLAKCPPPLASPWLQAWLWFWGMGCFVGYSLLQHKEPRYILPVAAPLFLLAGIGLTLPLRVPHKRVRVGGALLLLLVLGYTFSPTLARLHGPFFTGEQMEETPAFRYLNTQLPADVPVYINVSYPEFAYYTQHPIRVLPSGGGEDLYEAIDRIPQNGILAAYKPSAEYSDPDLKRIDADPGFVRVHESSLVVLYRRVLPALP